MKFQFLNFKTFIIGLFLLIFPATVNAIDNKRANNIYGIHLAQPHYDDLKKASELANSNGGDWGYVTLVIQENDRNYNKWQEIFNQLRELHLIPIIRLATQPEGEVWRRPTKDDADSWVQFLNSLNWVVKDRYIILFNEPNHGSEWGSEVDAKTYAEVAFNFARKLKEKNEDFFVMLAGLDASAPSSMPVMEDEEMFLKDVIDESLKIIINSQGLPRLSSPPGFIQKELNSTLSGNPSARVTRDNNEAIQQFNNLFDYIDGWSSHSYPNPGFVGSPYDYGRKSIRGYEWELSLLKNLGVDKELPVFITETGWERKAKSENLRVNNLEENIVANNYQIAFENIWGQDKRIMAVTPFVINYQSDPFLGFSWKKLNSDEYYQRYYSVQAISKTKGDPNVVDDGQINFKYPKELVAYSSFNLSINIKNLGQAIWDKDQGYNFRLVDFPQDHYLFSDLKNIRPFDEVAVNLFLKTNSQFLDGKKVQTKIVLYKDDNPVVQGKDWFFYVLPLPKMEIKVSLFPKINTQGNDFELQVFDEKENLVYKRTNVKARNNQITIDNIQNIVLGDKHRVVLLKPYYLPRQTLVVFKRNYNKIKFESMLPVDFDKDGQLTVKDMITLLKNPGLLSLYLPR